MCVYVLVCLKVESISDFLGSTVEKNLCDGGNLGFHRDVAGSVELLDFQVVK